MVLRVLTWKERTPVKGQVVRLLPPAAGKPIEKPTGEDGRVVFADVPAGKEWSLAVDVPPFAPVEMRGIAVKARRVNDLGDLLLGEKVVLRGKVVDEKGRPVPGAAVSAFTGGGLDLSQGFLLSLVSDATTFPTPVDEAKSDDKGLFALASLTPGTYRLMTKRSGYAMNLQADLVVSPERQSGLVTIVLGPPATLRGKVLDEKGDPVAGATVLAVEDVGGNLRGGATPMLRKDFTVSGPDGRYVLDTLIQNVRYRFGVAAKGRAPVFDAQSTSLTGDLERDFVLMQGGSLSGLVTDSATGKAIENARVVAIVGRPQPGGFGRGQGGRGGGGGGGGAGGNETPSSDTLSTQVATTDANGRYLMTNLRPGPIALLQVRAAGYSEPPPPAGDPRAMLAAMFGGGQSLGEIVAGETATVDLKMDPGGVIEGRVLAEGSGGSVPVAGAQVAVIPLLSIPNAPQMQIPDAGRGYPTAVADVEGRFRVDGVRLGATVSVIAHAGGFVASNPMTAETHVTMPATAGAPVSKDVTLVAAGTVEGVVRTTKGEPVSGARVRTRMAPGGGGFGPRPGGGFGGGSWTRMLFSGGSAGVALSDSEGRYRIDNVPSDDRLVAEADTDDLLPVPSAPFEVRAGETKTVDLVVQGGATIKGRVIDDHGKVVAGARLRVGTLDEQNASQKDLVGWRADGLLEPRFLGSDDEGWFEIAKVKPGPVLVKCEKPGFVTFYRRDLTVQPDQVVDNYMISLSRGETISGVVKGEDGRPIEGVNVSATARALPTGFGFGGDRSQPSASGETPNPVVEPALTARTDKDGRFTIDAIPPGGTYSVLVYFAQGYRGYAQGDEGAVRRDVAPGARDVELKLTKAEMPAGGPGGFPVPPGVRPPSPAPPGGMGGMVPVPPPSGMGG